jgi:methylenetetrahydrofolate dehydrogenase (NADP+)/methenyltetrahydrofolate cyclohydrolase
MQIIDGRAVSAQIKADIAANVRSRIQYGHRSPKLAAILVGNDGASATYVAHKERACAEVGILSEILRLDSAISEDELLGVVRRLNEDASVDGFIVQLPLPPHISEHKIIEAIAPHKDVDGFHPINMGRMAAGLPSMLPATPMGITELLRHYRIPTRGRHCVVLGRSNIVGRPLSILLSQKEFNCTVTLCHSATENIGAICRSADILVAAMGQPEFVDGAMIKDGAVVIDVGTTRVPCAAQAGKTGYRLTGDVKFEEAAAKCSYITPVPGGVGPMTIAALLKNTLEAYCSRIL